MILGQGYQFVFWYLLRTFIIFGNIFGNAIVATKVHILLLNPNLDVLFYITLDIMWSNYPVIFCSFEHDLQMISKICLGHGSDD